MASVTAMEPNDEREVKHLCRTLEALETLRRALEDATSALAMEVEFSAGVGPAMGIEKMPSLRCRANGAASEVEIYIEDPLLAYVEVRAADWVASSNELRADRLETQDGVQWLATLIAGRWAVKRRFWFFGSRGLRTSRREPFLFLDTRRQLGVH